ncbi:MAG: ArsR family transcriptional regulator [Bacilli bacterium]|nr:MAG: ArsR family transcriptional regulator [Bacilli bacterium]
MNIWDCIFRKAQKNKLEELEIEIMKKDIEIARLKKGYEVKGVGQEKEFVTTFSKNIK